MKFKDKGEERSKEGCGRVMALKIGNVVRSYTIESTMIPSFYKKIQRGSLKDMKNRELETFIPNYKEKIGI